MTPPPLARLLDHTADVVQGVLSGRSLADLLPALPAAVRPGTQALAFETLRRLGAARAALALLAPRAPPREAASLLLAALALLWPRERPLYTDPTLVDQAVRAARERAPAAAGFVNAVLRRFVRERAALVAQALARSPEARHDHPRWWIDRLQRDWPGQWEAILDQASLHPPMTLRVNARRGDAAGYVQRLAGAGLAARALDAQAVQLDAPCPVDALPGFAAGDVSVQDASAQRAAPLLLRGLKPNARVLDACAAPGGKTAHLLELADLDLLALDADPARLPRVHDALARLGLAATVRAGDARTPAAWWDGRPFDAILLDAPCSASGIDRRHPDIRWLRRDADIAALARTQDELLDALWPLLAPGGRLLYATCSVFRAEGQDRIDAFLQRRGPTTVRLDPASPGHLPGLPDNGPDRAGAAADGFFYALLHHPS